MTTTTNTLVSLVTEHYGARVLRGYLIGSTYWATVADEQGDALIAFTLVCGDLHREILFTPEAAFERLLEQFESGVEAVV